MKVAVAKYPVDAPADFAAFATKQRTLLQAAKKAGAELAVLPEYLALELAAGMPAPVRGDLPASLAALQPLEPAWRALYADLARDLGLTIQAGTFLIDVGGGRYRNRAWWFSADGRSGYQDKLQMTGFEKATGMIGGGEEAAVFSTGGVRAAIAVCYDAQFPLPVRTQWEAGARLLLVPSCTDTDAGATRVRVGCMARALENRMFVAQSVTAGLADWSPALDINTGEATIYAPMDHGMPADGLLARTRGEEVWAIASLDFAALEANRHVAQVANDHDWPRQYRTRAPRPASAPASFSIGLSGPQPS
ncbi:MAG TPA: carbon-nitrogen hydrolase family protein [Rhodanobacter sp.]